jgi:Tfp pilus assembly protein PilF
VALKKAPVSATVLKLYAARTRAGDSDAAATLTSWLDEHPQDAAVRLAYASTLHQGGKRTQAVAEYERVLKTQPGSVLALNNLAWLYFEDGDSRAIDLAERAYKRAPDRAEIIDTYGWLLIKSGRVEQGLGLLEKAAKRSPENGDIRYHLAAGLAQAGEKTRAKRELTALLDSETQFSEKAAAQVLLKELHSQSGRLSSRRLPVHVLCSTEPREGRLGFGIRLANTLSRCQIARQDLCRQTPLAGVATPQWRKGLKAVQGALDLRSGRA